MRVSVKFTQPKTEGFLDRLGHVTVVEQIFKNSIWPAAMFLIKERILGHLVATNKYNMFA